MRAAAACLLCLSACTIDVPSSEELTSLRLLLSSPKESELGRAGQPVTVSEVAFDVQAIGPGGALSRKDYEAQAFLAAGGMRLTLRSACGGAAGADMATSGDPWLLGRVALRAGEARGVKLPLSGRAIFGAMALNLEEPGTHAIGATPPIYFANPTIARLMEPWDPDARDASWCTPYLNRQVIIDGPPGQLIVSSVFKNGFGLTDRSAADEGAYGSIFVFTFSQPRTTIVRGRLIDRLSGSIAKFNGFTQVANVNYQTSEMVKPELLPAPMELTAARRRSLATTDRAKDLETNKWLQKRAAAPVTLTATVCDLSDPRRADTWNNYATFVVTFDPEPMPALDNCDSRKTFSVELPGRGFAGFDPEVHKGKSITVTGMLKNSAATTSGTLFWTLSVRETADLVVH